MNNVRHGRRILVITEGAGMEEDGVGIWFLVSGVPKYEMGAGSEDQKLIDGAWQDDSPVIYRYVLRDSTAKRDTVRVVFPFRSGAWQ
jgi:hypothetical protein